MKSILESDFRTGVRFPDYTKGFCPGQDAGSGGYMAAQRRSQSPPDPETSIFPGDIVCTGGDTRNCSGDIACIAVKTSIFPGDIACIATSTSVFSGDIVCIRARNSGLRRDLVILGGGTWILGELKRYYRW